MEHDPWKGLCDKCQTSTCCINFLTPLITPKELESVKKISGFSDIAESRTINGVSIHFLKTKPNTHECMFLGSDKKCTIYEDRPFECRIFPFDIYNIDGSLTWIVYTCNPELDWKWSEEILRSFEKDLLTPDVIKHMNAFMDLERINGDAGETYDFKILRKVNIVIKSSPS